MLFSLGVALCLLAGVVRHDLVFQPRWDLLGVTGGAFMVYGLSYPVLDALNGHIWPAGPGVRSRAMSLGDLYGRLAARDAAANAHVRPGRTTDLAADSGPRRRRSQQALSPTSPESLLAC